MFNKDELYHIAEGLYFNLAIKKEQLKNQEDTLTWLEQELKEFYAGESCENDIKECNEIITDLQNSIQSIKFIINKVENLTNYRCKDIN